MSRFSNNSLFTQAADRAMSLLNELLHLDNPALYTGLSGLQSAIDANPYDGTQWGLLGEAVGVELAVEWFNPLKRS
jgi:cytochrome c-type biogenesis protein CcmH/NrfG